MTAASSLCASFAIRFEIHPEFQLASSTATVAAGNDCARARGGGGYHARLLTHECSFYTSLNKQRALHLFLARDLQSVPQRLRRVNISASSATASTTACPGPPGRDHGGKPARLVLVSIQFKPVRREDRRPPPEQLARKGL
jgi:hypothetical protein